LESREIMNVGRGVGFRSDPKELRRVWNEPSMLRIPLTQSNGEGSRWQKKKRDRSDLNDPVVEDQGTKRTTTALLLQPSVVVDVVERRVEGREEEEGKRE
jgi:hypothetical protein